MPANVHTLVAVPLHFFNFLFTLMLERSSLAHPWFSGWDHPCDLIFRDDGMIQMEVILEECECHSCSRHMRKFREALDAKGVTYSLSSDERWIVFKAPSDGEDLSRYLERLLPVQVDSSTAFHC